MRASSVLVLVLAAAAPALGALRFTLNPTVQTGDTSGCINFSGGCVVFSGTLENDGADNLVLNDASVALTLPGGATLSSDPNFFFANVPGLLCSHTDAVCPFPSTYTGPIFQVNIAATTPMGAYPGSVTIVGGSFNTALASQNFQVNLGVVSPIQITTAPALPTGTAGQIYPQQQFEASGGTPPYAWSATPLPTGLTIDNTGLLKGTPTVGSQGSYPTVIQVKDSLNALATVSRTLSVNPQLVIAPLSLSVGTLGSAYGPVQFTATGGSDAYAWTATGLPTGINFTMNGILNGTPAIVGTTNPQFKVTDSNNATASVSLLLTIRSAPPPLITSLSPNPVTAAIGVQTIFISGAGFQSGAGLKVHLSNGTFQTDVTSGQLTFLSGSQLSILADVGTTAANWTATVINPDNQSSNAFAFTVQPVQSTMFAVPQFTFGGGWYTALYFANTTNSVLHIQVSFFDDAGGSLTVPLLGIGAVSSRSIDLNPQSTAILEAPNSGPQQQGWAEVTLPTGVTGYAVFRQSVAGRADQEAVVPLTPQSSATADLTYDDIDFTTAVAFLNPTAQPMTVSINVFDVNGAPAGSTQQTVGPHSKVAAILKDIQGLSGISGKRGRAVFSAASGAVSVLGLRFGGSAFTSIPVTHRPAIPETRTISFALPQFVFGGLWYTALYLSNTTNSPVSVPVTFTGDNGAPLTAPLLGIGSVTSQTMMLTPGATRVLEAPSSGPEGQGWVEASVPPGVTGYAVFRQTVTGRNDQEAAVPLTPESSQAADLVYDDTAYTTAVAFLNPSDQQVAVTISVFSATGSQLGSAQVILTPRSKTATILRNLPGLSGMAGNRGWAAFSVPNGDVSVLGLRFAGEAFTSIPVTDR